MRAGPLSNTNVVALLNRHFVPVYVVNEDYARKGSAPAEEKSELQAIFKQGHAAKKSVGSVHVYILNAEGNLIDSMHVAEAAKTKQLAALLEKTVADLKVQLAASGLDVPFLADADPKEFRPVIEAQIKAWAASVGRRHGMEYAEEFRRVRFGDMERWARGAGTALGEDV